MFYKKRRIYLDYASATPVRKEARLAYEAASSLVGNPGSIHKEGVEAKRVLEESRAAIAKELGCKAREIIFTSGLTEANNLAILGTAQKIEREKGSLAGTHWIVSSIEHQSVLECFVEVERRGGKVTNIDPEANGVVSVQKVENALRKETVLVSIGWANSEIGTVQPIREISFAIRAHPVRETSSSNGAGEKKTRENIIFHSDAGQGPLYLSPEVHTLGVDLFSLGSGKLYGTRGIGALYVGKRCEVAPITIGGGQERGWRAGTEAPALAAGFSTALQAAGGERHIEAVRLTRLRDQLAEDLLARIPKSIVNGDMKRMLPHMLNISIPGINSEYVVLALDRVGIAVSTKSACSEGRLNESHVVAALPGGSERARSTIRCSLGRDTTERDTFYFLDQLTEILKKMPVREM